MRERKAERSLVFAHLLLPGLSALSSERETRLWERVMEVCGDYTARLLPSSGGRGITLDLTDASRLLGSAKSLAQEVRNRLRGELGVEVAIGLGPSALVARLAARKARPGAMVEVTPRETGAFLARQPIAALPGVETEWARWLGEMGIKQLGDLAALSEESAERALGARGKRMWELLQGREPEGTAAPVESAEEPVVSAQVGLRPATGERIRVRAALRLAAEQVAQQLQQRGETAAQVRVEVVFQDLRRVVLRRTLPRATQSRVLLFQVARALYDHAKLGRRLVRRVRVHAARLSLDERGRQLMLPLAEQAESELCPPSHPRSRNAEPVHGRAQLLSRNRAGKPV